MTQVIKAAALPAQRKRKFQPPKFKPRQGVLTTNFMVSDESEMVYRRQNFELRGAVYREARSIEFGLMIRYLPKDGRELEWLSLGHAAHTVLATEEALKFYRELESTYILDGFVAPELLALIGKIIDKVWLSKEGGAA